MTQRVGNDPSWRLSGLDPTEPAGQEPPFAALYNHEPSLVFLRPLPFPSLPLPSKPSARSRAPRSTPPFQKRELRSRLGKGARFSHILLLPLRCGGSRSPPGPDLQNPKPGRGRVGAGRRPVGRQPWRPSTAATWSSTRSGSSSPTSVRPRRDPLLPPSEFPISFFGFAVPVNSRSPLRCWPAIPLVVGVRF